MLGLPLTAVPIAIPQSTVPAVGINGFGRIGASGVLILRSTP